uniref:Growth-regulating factor n=1 Tax=Ananas comosus var. bracteatus TaxID=296719 RepID=A0A6V7QM35_ANACO|nr:unnamed protein product [Ananas comosus var. bracteatus]
MESNTAEVGEKRDRSHDQEDLGHSFGFKCNSFHTLVRSPVIAGARTSGGGSGSVGGVTMAMTSAFPFTAVQWAELQRQALIYKHIIASVPVPYYLLIPVSNLEFANMYFIHAVYNLKYLNTMELEARRCHRTDGKKWRCSREAAPDRKYCDHHMRRTRPRSRKHILLPFPRRVKHLQPKGECRCVKDRWQRYIIFSSISTLLRLSVSCNTMEGSRSSIGGPLGEVLVSLSESSSSDSPSFVRSENVRVGE